MLPKQQTTQNIPQGNRIYSHYWKHWLQFYSCVIWSIILYVSQNLIKKKFWHKLSGEPCSLSATSLDIFIVYVLICLHKPVYMCQKLNCQSQFLSLYHVRRSGGLTTGSPAWLIASIFTCWAISLALDSHAPFSVCKFLFREGH